MSAWKETLSGWWHSDRVRRWLVVLGVVGIALLALPELLPEKGGSAAAETSVTTDEVEQALEQRIAALIRQVEGVGECQVMVTLERGEQTLYAANTVTATTPDTSSQEQMVLTVDTDTGPVGLPMATLQPAVKGVAVVCQGGGDEAVRQQVTDLIATVFHISDRRVCVAKLK